MDRLACVDVSALALQLLARVHPEWRGRAIAALEHEGPNGLVLWVDTRAARAGVVPGLRYAAALAVCPALRAGAVAQVELAHGVGEIVSLLRGSSPHVEPCAGEPGVFWLDASGLVPLFASLSGWADEIVQRLRGRGLASRVAVGFRRFGTYAAARSLAAGGRVVLESPDDESALARGAYLAELGLHPDVQRELEALGVRSVHEFLRLPSGGILQRFGVEAQRLHALASGELALPFEPEPDTLPVRASVDLEYPERSAARLVELVGEEARRLLAELEARGEAVRVLELALRLENGGAVLASLAPSAPTRDLAWLLRLLRLRLESTRLPAAVERVGVELRGARATAGELRLFAEHQGRDLTQAARAFDALRAAFGDAAVVCARPCSEHLPEASFVWQRLARIVPPRPRRIDVPCLARRIHAAPRELFPAPSPQIAAPDTPSAAERRVGPYVLDGGWWVRAAHRRYFYVERESGEIDWLYYDGAQRRWYLQGRVS